LLCFFALFSSKNLFAQQSSLLPEKVYVQAESLLFCNTQKYIDHGIAAFRG